MNKKKREIQAARDVERDMLSVNGVLVKGSEGYPVVVGKVKRELARLAEPVAGPDGVIAGRRGGGGGTKLPSSMAASLPVPGGDGGAMQLQRPAHSLSQVVTAAVLL